MKKSNIILLSFIVLSYAGFGTVLLRGYNSWKKQLPKAEAIADMIDAAPSIPVINITGENLNPEECYGNSTDSYNFLRVLSLVDENSVRLSGDTLYVNCDGESMVYYQLRGVKRQIINGVGIDVTEQYYEPDH